jgi:hypothetical protein
MTKKFLANANIPIVVVTGGDGSNSSIKATGYNQRGGTGYHGFLEATNTYGSATNPNKYFRINSTGSLQIVNSGYTTTLFDLTDSGALAVPSTVTASGFAIPGGTSSQYLLANGGVGSGSTYTPPLTETALATGFSIAGGTTSKTLTVSNTITLAGTDGTTITLPATTGTVPLNNQTFYIGTQAIAINAGTGTITSLPGVTSINGATLPSSGTIITGSSPTITTPVIDTVNTSLTTTGTAALWNTGLTTGTIQIGGAITSGTLTLGGTGTATAGTVNILTGATTSGTKAINIGTNGSTGSITTINIGTTAGTTPTIALNGTTTFNGRIISTLTGTDVTGNGQIYLNGATSNRLEFNSTGLAAPAVLTRSVGTKIVLYPSLATSAADYALGIDSGVFWQSIDSSTSSFKWYAGNTNIATLSGAGAFSTTSTISASGLAGSLLSSTVGSTSGTASAGISTIPARADHVHPSSTPAANSVTLAMLADEVKIMDIMGAW